MSIFPRPLKQVLGRIIPFSQEDKIPTFNLGSGTADSTTYLRGDGSWSSVSGVASNKMYTVGRNSTGSTLYKGTIVYISGSTGNRPNFVKAQANSEATSAGTFGVIEADIPNNSDGNCVTIGTLDNLDTRTTATHPFTDVTLADGDTIYLHPTVAGYITNVKPSAPNHLVYVGKVVRTHPTLGTIVYRIQNGYEIDELHDVAIASPTNGQILQYESATSLWKNVTPSSGGITIGTTTITSGTVGRVLFEGTSNKVQESANFYWDDSNARLSIGQGSSPGARVDIRSSGALSTDLALRVRNSANTFNSFQVNGDNSIYFMHDGGEGAIRFFRQTGHSSVIQHRSTATLPSIFTIGTLATGGSIGQIVFDTQQGDGSFSTFTMHRFISGMTDLTGASIQGSFGATNTACFTMKNSLNYQGFGSIPTTTPADHFAMYAADIVAGNAAPHFRTENGSIIKLYKETTAVTAATFVTNTSAILNDTATFDGYTIGQVVKALRNLGILA